MAVIQQEILGVLLDTLLHKNLIHASIYDKAVNLVNSRGDYPAFFENRGCFQKERNIHGCAQD